MGFRTPIRRLWALALVGNIMLAGGLALAIAPASTAGGVLDAYDGLPDWARAILGEPVPLGTGEQDVVAGGAADASSGDAAQRGPVGRFLERFLLDAVAGDAKAQSRLPLHAAVDVNGGGWTHGRDVIVSWRTYGEPLDHVISTVAAGEPIDGAEELERTSGASYALVDLPEGEIDVVVQAFAATSAGTLERVAGIRVDSSPPPMADIVVHDATVPEGEASSGADWRVTDYAVSLSWSAVDDVSGVTGYLVERSVDGGITWEERAAVDGDVRGYLDANVPNGVYSYRVRAVNGAGLSSAEGGAVDILVDARGGLETPEPGVWDYGIKATFDSVLHVYPIDDASVYLDLRDLERDANGNVLSFGSLSGSDYDHYTASGWGVETDNETLQEIVREHVAGDTNTLRIGMKLFEWLFDATDYDFDKFNSASGGDFLRAGETLDRGRGICGDLTALYVTAMRIAGVPARPVHGYLLNTNATGVGQTIGGFHMWAEIYVGGPDPLGDGWIPVDVSGVTGSFAPKHLDIYFGVANPDYLQLGIQRDLGDDDLPLTENGDEPMRNRWNVWANLRWSYKATGSDVPELTFQAETEVAEVQVEQARLWFDPATHERRVCPAQDTDCGGGLRYFYPDLKLRSVRTIDYGATLQWNDDRVDEVQVQFKFPKTPAPNQAAMWVPYEKDTSCRAIEAQPDPAEEDFLRWTIGRTSSPCRA